MFARFLFLIPDGSSFFTYLPTYLPLKRTAEPEDRHSPPRAQGHVRPPQPHFEELAPSQEGTRVRGEPEAGRGAAACLPVRMALLVLPEKRQLGARDGHLAAIVKGQATLASESGCWFRSVCEEVERLACGRGEGEGWTRSPSRCNGSGQCSSHRTLGRSCGVYRHAPGP